MNIDKFVATSAIVLVFFFLCLFQYLIMKARLAHAEKKCSFNPESQPDQKCISTISQNGQDKIIKLERSSDHE